MTIPRGAAGTKLGVRVTESVGLCAVMWDYYGVVRVVGTPDSTR